MPLKLVTGPANAAKAGEVLGALRARLDEEPILVVPSFGDVEHHQRELAERGAVLGARVARFAWLFEIVAERLGLALRSATRLQRELIAERAVAAAGLRVLADSARRPGFPPAVVRLAAELERSMVEPDRLRKALRAWTDPAGEHAARRDYAEEVAEIYTRYREGHETAGLVDAELLAWRALDALHREPHRFGRTPVYVYGFDDFTELELDAIETLATRADALVTVSLPYEPGRVAFKAVAGVLERLRPIAAEVVELDALDEHYAPAARRPLHHLERELFGDAPVCEDPGDAVRLLSAGGERAEVELVGAQVLRLLRDGVAPGDVAVVYRDPDGYGSVVEQVFEAYGIPFSIDRDVPLAHTGLGRGLLALLRCGCGLEATADDLLAYLRTPGLLDEPRLADRLEAEVRRGGRRTAEEARSLWEERRWPLDEIDELGRAAEAGTAQLAASLARRLERLFSRPYERRAHVLERFELDDARVLRAARRALDEVRELGLDARRLHDVLAGLPVRLGETPQPDRVQVAGPEAIRARRFAAVFVCGLQEGEFPRLERPEPFLSDDDRRAIALASDLALPVREDRLDRERYLFYVCASRAERSLYLSRRYCDEEGRPQVGSFFVEDVRDLFSDLPEERRRLGDVTFSLDDAPTAPEWERAAALASERVEPRRPDGLFAAEVLERLAAQPAFSAGAIERFADCPVKWVVEDLLGAHRTALEPDPEQMVRGAYAHEVLETTYRRLREQTGSRRVTPANLPDAERLMLEALEEHRAEFRISPAQTRARAAVRRLEFDLLRYLAHEAASDSEFEPAELELGFGLDADQEVALNGVKVRGRVDRVDVWDRFALVRDYKTGSSVSSYKLSDWEKENRLQVALYMLAVQRVLGLEPAGGVYVPLGGVERRPRGIVAEEVAARLGADFFDNDVVPQADFERHLERAREAACDVVERLRAGRISPCPDSCAWRGRGCSYPAICREES